jgi:hypothetical protein
VAPPASHLASQGTPAPRPPSLAARLLRRLTGRPAALATLPVRIDDESPGWTRTSAAASNERDPAEIQEQYQDALTAWRENPIAKRIVDIITDYCLGDGLTPTAHGQTGDWITRFWNHPKNNMPIRMHELSDELTRAGDLFLTLHRNPDDGISYVRPIPKDRILEIQTLPNDWETELSYVESRGAMDQVTWLSPAHPDAPNAPAVMLHYRVNGVVGALMGESDLATLIPWLQRYSRMLEDRVRLHWALKAFLWLVTVPTNMVTSKTEQYRSPPEGGSIIVKDPSESWEAQTPNLHAFDAQYDLQAVRSIIDAGSGFPPHWRGEATDVNLATATAMERAASRHLRRRQLYLRHLVIDLVHTAHLRAWEISRVHPRPRKEAIRCDTTDLSRQDNETLARAANLLSMAITNLTTITGVPNDAMRAKTAELILRFAGEQLDPADLSALTAGYQPSTPGIAGLQPGTTPSVQSVPKSVDSPPQDTPP